MIVIAVLLSIIREEILFIKILSVKREMSRWPGVLKLIYRSDDFNFTLKENIESKLDTYLRATWEKTLNLNVFRYKLNIESSKVLPGKYFFLAQLNEERATNRRKPQVIQEIGTPFNPDLFNFTRLKEEEILFQLVHEEDSKSKNNYVAINASPLEYGNCLLLPELEECQPQIVTEDGLKFATNFLLLSGSLDLRVGFNGLCGFASVNHHHYHAYYLNKRMLLEQIAVQHLSGPCYELVNYPAEGFVFQLHQSNIKDLVRNVYTLTRYLQDHCIAHNLYLTRGCSFDDSVDSKCFSNQGTVRIYVWARKPSHGAKEVDAFNPALCELFGHLPMKDRDSYNALTEEFVSSILYDTCHDVYVSVRENVKKLFGAA